eukprot:SAG11_NODE_31374_length_292_cov_0.834197_1_plen_46_part_01
MFSCSCLTPEDTKPDASAARRAAPAATLGNADGTGKGEGKGKGNGK